VRSRRVGDEFKVFVATCGVDPDTKPSVLYLTDGNGLFGSTVDAILCNPISAACAPWPRDGAASRS
jgi:predicted alpha/beta superfamily hydrolase